MGLWPFKSKGKSEISGNLFAASEMISLNLSFGVWDFQLIGGKDG